MADEMRKREQLLVDFHNGFMVNQTSKHIEQLFGNNKGYGVRTCQRWFKKFREGNFDLEEKPTHGVQQKLKQQKAKLLLPVKEELTNGATNGKTANRKLRSKRVPQKEVKVSLVTFKEEHKKNENGDEQTSAGNEVVQKLIQRKREITVSKVANVKAPWNSSVSAKQVLAPLTRNSTTLGTRNASKRQSANPLLAQQLKKPAKEPPPKSKQRCAEIVEIDLKLPLNIVQRMRAAQASTETHTIGEGRKTTPKLGETATSKTITVQFQNVNPELAKNTVRITTNEPTTTTPINVNKRLAVAQSTPLSSPKGVIYLNPQEIFRQNFDCQKSEVSQRSITNGSVSKTENESLSDKTPNGVSLPITPSQETLPPSINCDSDSDDDLVFPKDASIPPPKVKAVVETFTTYFDLDSDKPIILNPTDNMATFTPVIEID